MNSHFFFFCIAINKIFLAYNESYMVIISAFCKTIIIQILIALDCLVFNVTYEKCQTTICTYMVYCVYVMHTIMYRYRWKIFSTTEKWYKILVYTVAPARSEMIVYGWHNDNYIIIRALDVYIERYNILYSLTKRTRDIYIIYYSI